MRYGRIGLIAAGLLGAAAWAAAPSLVDRTINRVRPAPPASPAARGLWETLEIADLHADSLLWGRPLLKRNRRGQVDLPRLRDGHYALQVFGVVTKMPRRLSGSNDGRTDWIGPLSWLQRWPWRTHASLAERALFQASRLRALSENSRGKFLVIRTAADLKSHRRRRKTEPGLMAGMLAVEGAHALEGDLQKLDSFFDAGVRMMAPTHFFDTELGGSAHGKVKGGLTPLGRRWLAEMEKRRMIVDLAHASPETFADAIFQAKRPVVVSHTGVRGTCDNRRNLSDDQLRMVARNGGLVGIGYWEMAVCGKDAAAVARAIRHAVKVAGVSHVALGSDFDGAVVTPFDAAQLDRLADALLAEKFPEEQIRAVMGTNLLDFLERNLP